MFESTAALVRCSAAADPGMVPQLETHLFPAFTVVLQDDVQVGHTLRELDTQTKASYAESVMLAQGCCASHIPVVCTRASKRLGQ